MATRADEQAAESMSSICKPLCEPLCQFPERFTSAVLQYRTQVRVRSSTYAYWSSGRENCMRPTDVSTPARLAHLTKDGRGYPILATVSRSHSGVDFGALSELRKLALATFDWCG